jgi:hypothetical protein
VPRQSLDTFKPDFPKLTYCMAIPLLLSLRTVKI